MVFVYQGAPDQADLFFGRLDPGATAIADPEGELYRLFGVERGGFRAMFGLRSWVAGIRATRQGHRINRKIGDPWTLPTMVAIEDDEILWEFRGDHAGDHPDVSAIPALIGTRP